MQYRAMTFKPYDSRSHNQNVRMTSFIRYLLDARSVRCKSRIRQSKTQVVPSKPALKDRVKRTFMRLHHLPTLA